MLKKLTIIIALFAVTSKVNAQKNNSTDKSASFTVAFGSKQFSTALAYQHLWKVGKKQRAQIGLGARFTSNFGNNVFYRTAPAALTSGKTGPAAMFANDITQNIDSVSFKKTQVNALNLSINLAYTVYKKITLGFNIDAVGFSFGGKQNGIYYANNGVGTATTAKPSGFNVLLISDNDKGSLNSEFYARYKFNNNWGAKLGFQFLFTEYTTATEIQTTPDGQKNDRFRNKASGISFGITRNF
jgi:hypothetical protein